MGNQFDKRDTSRMKTDAFYVQYKLTNDATVFVVEVVNISSGGILFIRDSVLHKKDELQILFPFKTRKLLLKGTVVRVEGREVAVEFNDKAEKIELFVKLFNDEYRAISEENKRHSINKESLFPHKD